MKKLFSTVMLASLIISMLTLAFNIQPVRASETIYIRADGSVEGTTQISSSNNITYMFTSNIYDSIVVERDNVLLDGQGYLLQGTGSFWDGSIGITLFERSNVTLRNIEIKSFIVGIGLNSSSGSTISGNNITSNFETGVRLYSSFDNTVIGNKITNNAFGVYLYYSANNIVSGNIIIATYGENYGDCIRTCSSSDNIISGNNITKGMGGIYLEYSSHNNTVSENNVTNNINGVLLFFSSNNNTVTGNKITNNVRGVYLSDSSDNNMVSGNNIINNDAGIHIGFEATPEDKASNNTIYHNNFVDNTQQTYIVNLTNIWDNGCEGNFWGDYNGTDSDGDGIGDTPYILDSDNQDDYPLMNPYWNPSDINHDLIVDIFDIVRAAGAYGSTPLDTNWNPHCDIAEAYGIIDIFDIVTIAMSYGKEYGS